MVSTVFRAGRAVSMVALLVGTLTGASLQEATAQPTASQSGALWLQTATVVTPIERGPTRAFLDTLVNVVERKDGIRVLRSPDAEKRMDISSLRSALISEEGIGVTSANHAFIDYRFSIDNGSRFRQTIRSIHFVFRPGPQQTDISVLYLDAQQPWVKEVIHRNGTSLRSNQAAVIPFHRHLGFANIARQEKSEVVEVAGETIRSGFDERKEDLIQKVQRLTYETFV